MNHQTKLFIIIRKYFYWVYSKYYFQFECVLIFFLECSILNIHFCLKTIVRYSTMYEFTYVNFIISLRRTFFLYYYLSYDCETTRHYTHQNVFSQVYFYIHNMYVKIIFMNTYLLMCNQHVTENTTQWINNKKTKFDV